MTLRLRLVPPAQALRAVRRRRGGSLGIAPGTYKEQTFTPTRWFLVGRKDTYHPSVIGTLDDAVQRGLKRAVELGTTITIVGDHTQDPDPSRSIRETWFEIRVPQESILRHKGG